MVEVTGTKDEFLNYGKFLIRIDQERISYNCLILSACVLQQSFLDTGLRSHLELFKFNLSVHSPTNPGQSFTLTIKDVEGMIQDIATRTQSTMIDTLNSTLRGNAHFLRTRVLNNLYEAMVYHFKGNGQQNILRSNDWYLVLYFLRNLASHFDKKGQNIDFPKWMKDKKITTVSWKTIAITDGMLADEINYNDKEVFDLIETIRTYFRIPENMQILVK